MSPPLVRWFPFDPLKKIIDARAAEFRKPLAWDYVHYLSGQRITAHRGPVAAIEPYLQSIGLSARWYYRCQQSSRVGWDLADRVCIALKIHPALVYGYSWTAMDAFARAPQIAQEVAA